MLARRYSTATTLLQRSLLYVPASNHRMLQKSLTSESDALIYDLEDSVAPNEKARARGALLEFLKARCSFVSYPRHLGNVWGIQAQNEQHAKKTFVRLNALDTAQFEDDITTIV
ncbi:citrate lyase subunit beta-like protein [Ceratobasidium sp. AG-Ba]|nr:citrate lyase subunit beta-like protein [Ceratobasidium sp. AG-Ba]